MRQEKARTSAKSANNGKRKPYTKDGAPSGKGPAVSKKQRTTAPSESTMHEERKRDEGVYSIFVGNIPYTHNHLWLAERFEKCGKVVDSRIVREKKTGKSRGFGYVDFATAEAQEAALEAKIKIMDRLLEIKKTDEASKVPITRYEEKVKSLLGKNEPSDTVFIDNLFYGTSEKSLSEKFGECGTIKSIRFAKHQDTGRPKGYVLMKFSSKEEAAKARQLDGRLFNGRQLLIDYARPWSSFQRHTSRESAAQDSQPR
ncbi:hypothetical protein GQ54DRAFT_297070 [Martensiomyces pterosporus]|nr:hypothetical protein GQ54DRAFT_297070 [Martensiomyces pterosporus]